MRWPIVGTLFLLACRTDDHTLLEDRVFVAVADAWQAADLRDPYDDRKRRLEDFRIHAWPSDLDGEQLEAAVASFEVSCPQQWYEGRLVHAAACLHWRYEPGRVRTIVYPVAIISPLVDADRHAAAAIHELCHAFLLAAYRNANNLHTDPRIWERTKLADGTWQVNPWSVETMAERQVYDGVPAWPPNPDAQ